MRPTKEIDDEIRAMRPAQAMAAQHTIAAWPAQGTSGNLGSIGPYQDTGTMLPYDPSPFLSAATAKLASLGESIAAHPFVILWYNSSASRYERYWAVSDEDAIEKARKTMELPNCTQLQIFEVAHRWEKEWQKR